MSIIKFLKFITLSVVSATLLLTLEVATVGFDSAFAQEAKKKRKTNRVESIKQANTKVFEKVQLALEEKNPTEATRLLDQLARKDDLNNIEKAYLHNFRGTICFEADKLNCALREYKLVTITEEGLPESFYNQMLYVVAQVLFSQEKYREALGYIDRWFKTQESPGADAYMLAGQAHYMLKEYDAALPKVQTGIQKYVEVGSVPKEGWLNLLSYIYRQKNDYRKMLPVLKQLVQHYPKKTYLITMGGVFNELNDPARMTSMYQALYDEGLLDKEAEMVTLAQLSMSQDNPYNASRIMERGLKSGVIKANLKNNRIYSQALFAAREYEKALDPLGKAAGLAKNGKLFNQLGLSYVQLNRWREAEGALKKAINKRGLVSPGSVFITLGLTQFEQKKFKEAEATFNRATKYEKVSSDARNWIRYVKSEQQRIRELEAPIPEIDTSVEPVT